MFLPVDPDRLGQPGPGRRSCPPRTSGRGKGRPSDGTMNSYAMAAATCNPPLGYRHQLRTKSSALCQDLRAELRTRSSSSVVPRASRWSLAPAGADGGPCRSLSRFGVDHRWSVCGHRDACGGPPHFQDQPWFQGRPRESTPRSVPSHRPRRTQAHLKIARYVPVRATWQRGRGARDHSRGGYQDGPAKVAWPIHLLPRWSDSHAGESECQRSESTAHPRRTRKMGLPVRALQRRSPPTRASEVAGSRYGSRRCQ